MAAWEERRNEVNEGKIERGRKREREREGERERERRRERNGEVGGTRRNPIGPAPRGYRSHRDSRPRGEMKREREMKRKRERERGGGRGRERQNRNKLEDFWRG